MRRWRDTKLGRLVLLTGLLIASFGLFSMVSTSALSGSSFNAGRIIDDAVFYKGTAMSVSSIQSFLNSKVPTCDTNGTQSIYGTTRSAYGTSKGYPPPYTCLKDKKYTTPGKSAASGLCNSVPKRSSKVSAAQVIYDVAKSCGVSPKVLIVLLQKEQSLVTDDWPWSVQYTKATGYGCPDSSLSSSVDANHNGCYDSYEGFFKQIYYAARQYKNYRKNPDAFNFIAGESNYIPYNPSAACGGSNVYIQNQATAGLYNYTPYQPNTAALNNLYGTGNSCSAYGNRNFWRMYIDWFGSTYTTTSYAFLLESQEVYSNSGMTTGFTSTPTVAPGGKFYVRIKARNMGNKPWDNSVIVRLGTSHSNDRVSAFQDESWLTGNRAAQLMEPSVVPGEVGTFEFTMTAPAQTGTYREYFNLVVEGKTWMKDAGLNYLLNVVSPLSLSPSSATLSGGSNLEPGESITAPDEQSVLVFQGDGNLVLYSNFKAIWSSGTQRKGGTLLAMQSDGNLVLYDKDSKPVWHTHTNGNNNSRLVLQPDGNLVLYNASSSPLWYTSTTHRPDHLSYVNNTAQNSILFPGQRLETASRNYKLIFQTDGNLVLYSSTHAIWSSKTAGKAVSCLLMQADGNLVIYSTGGKAIWNTKTYHNKNATLALQQDGNVVIYSTSGKPLWNTHTNGIE